MSSPQEKRRVVITGYGMITPSGRSADETFDNCSRGISGIDYIKSFDTTGLPCRIAGEVDDTWIDEFESRTDQRLKKFSSRGLRLMRIATAEAAGRAGLDSIRDRAHIGVSLGSHGDNMPVEDMQFILRFYREDGTWDMKGLLGAGGYPYLNFFRRKADAAASLLAVFFDCKGPLLSIASACAAGSQAIGEAACLIRDGKSPVMIAGGCEATINFSGMTGFILLKALCEKYSEPQKASRPFDRRRGGFVMSEGAGALVLEDMEYACARGARILGELKGYGSSADAYRITDTHPKGLGAVIAMKAALDDAGVMPGDIDYINAHGTSTVQNDLTETRAIQEVFGERAREIPVSSNKSMLGHTIAAAGPIECILTLMGINRSLILPTINYESRDPKCNLDYVPNEARHREHSLVLSNSFGFGGQNACLCVGRFPQ
ncbi:MAG: beta-ketoacyl-[acyl-carrier-protein] synthase family protein [Nitrospiraceae bacterium]|nr:MAG: beta-ketoacyl-[acyl-carrier-protein] synthase family protein [Nitrospiraceae bacterium]